MSERRLLAVVVVAALASLTVPVAWAQVAQSTDEQALVAKSQTFSRLYREQKYGEALAAAEEAITLAQRMKRFRRRRPDALQQGVRARARRQEG